jgi:hypothetical protein
MAAFGAAFIDLADSFIVRAKKKCVPIELVNLLREKYCRNKQAERCHNFMACSDLSAT